MSDFAKTSGGDRVRAAREGLGWTQARLASEADTTQQTVDRIERGLTSHSRALPKIEAAINAEIKSRAGDGGRMHKLFAERRGHHSPLPTRNHSFPILSLQPDGAVEFVYFSQLATAWTDTAASYALIINTREFDPIFPSKDILFVDFNRDPVPGSYVIATEFSTSDDLQDTPVQLLKFNGATEESYKCETLKGVALKMDKNRFTIDPVVSRYTPMMDYTAQPI